MDFALALENHGRGVSPDGIAASADAVERHGWRSLYAVDHLAVDHGQERDYGRILEALLSLTWIAATHPRLRVATGVIVPPMRDAMQLAKEIATLDVLTGGRVLVGVGVGDNEDEGEYRNLGKGDRFHVRGRYLDETIALWRHLWSGRTDPFVGQFHNLTDYCFEPLPVQGGNLPILSGGRSDRALSRVGRLSDGLYSSRWGPDDLAPRWPGMLATARENGMPRPYLATRVRVRIDAAADGRYSLCGRPEDMVADLVRFADIGVDEFVAVFATTDATEIDRVTTRFQHEVVEPFLVRRSREPAAVEPPPVS